MVCAVVCWSGRTGRWRCGADCSEEIQRQCEDRASGEEALLAFLPITPRQAIEGMVVILVVAW